MDNNKTVAVIGGGAAGLTAAIQAARRNCRVTVFEKQDRCGKKIAASGNGQCNISNRNIEESRYHGADPSFAIKVIEQFDNKQTEKFFLSIGIPFREGKNGKLYPYSLQAGSVVNALLYEAGRHNVAIHTHRQIESIVKISEKFVLRTAGHEDYTFDAVILANGGCTYPSLGGNSTGYIQAMSFKHTVKEPFPAIVPVNIPLKRTHRLEGIKWDVRLTVLIDGENTDASAGELLFTKYGISGPVTLDISRSLNDPACNNKDRVVEIDFFPERSLTDLESMLADLFNAGERKIAFALEGVLKKRIPEVILESVNIHTNEKTSNGSKHIPKIARALKQFRITSGEARGFAEAVVAAGGVLTNEVNPATMESKLVKGLYITGELLDIDGDSGGYNLQFAWSSGAVAGMNV
jgi:predicted Rossmann fold flavoprotein